MNRLAPILLILLALSACASPTAVDPTPTALPDVVSSTPAASASIAPVGLAGTIAYVAGADPQIHLLDLASGESRQLTNLGPTDAQVGDIGPMRPAMTCGFGPSGLTWAPDGSLLAFAYGGCEGVVHTVDLDGNVRRIGEGSGPAWSPDGARLAFSPNIPYLPCGVGCLDPELGPWDIRVVDPRGEEGPVPLTANGGRFTASGATYSPDGSLVAFAGPSSVPDPTGMGSSAAYVVGADGGGQQHIADRMYPAGWLADGRLVCVETDGRVSAVSIESGEAEVLFGESAFQARPSPDGTHLALLVMDPVTGTNGTVIRGPEGDIVATLLGSAASWSPDGAHVAVTQVGVAGAAISVHAVDGTEIALHRVDLGTGSLETAWRPSP